MDPHRGILQGGIVQFGAWQDESIAQRSKYTKGRPFGN